LETTLRNHAFIFGPFSLAIGSGTADVVISDVVIVTTSTTAPVCIASTPAKESSCPLSGSNSGVQLKLKVDETGLGLVKETLSSEVSCMQLHAGV